MEGSTLFFFYRSKSQKERITMSYTVDDLKLKISENIDKLDYPAAHLFCQKGLELEPKNVELLELTAQVELELEQFEAAHDVKKYKNICFIHILKLNIYISIYYNQLNLHLMKDIANICIWDKC